MSKLNVQGSDTEKINAQKAAQTQKEESFMHKAGDVVERVGEKLKDMGAEKLGQAVYKAGNKLEHSEETKKH